MYRLNYYRCSAGPGPPLKQGATIPESHASSATEFDDISNTFDPPTRAAERVALSGYGDAFAGRGASLNQTIQALNPLFIRVSVNAMETALALLLLLTLWWYALAHPPNDLRGAVHGKPWREHTHFVLTGWQSTENKIAVRA